MARMLSPRLVVGAPAVHAGPRGRRRARPRAGVPARRRRDRAPRGRGHRAGLARERRARRVLEDDVEPSTSRTPRCPTSRGSSTCWPATSRRAIAERFADDLPNHPLHREIITTVVVNDMINRSGTTFVHRAIEETGVDLGQVARAYSVVRTVFGLPAAVGRRSRHSTTRCRPRPSTPATRRSAGSSTARRAGSSTSASRSPTSRPRSRATSRWCRGSARAAPTSCAARSARRCSTTPRS